ncbi:MerR family transcriptional regulator [Ferrimonas senticii]|uniref:MerR family transcriptional regulator n=1 Tax=Ferrimonas senticii TaxID=394566 RepID=UPI00040172A9|nr:MerR family transcriptional regulator [Ferrimonas senticii]
MITITQLARQHSLSRTTLLYYEREQLLLPTLRAANGYRYYDAKAVARLQQICSYRSYGLGISEIKQLLSRDDLSQQAALLSQHFSELEQQIEQLRQQQHAIMLALQQPQLAATVSMSKARWVAMMQTAGFDEAQMRQWHRNFEQSAPASHLQFLRSLGIDEVEIDRIRSDKSSY